MTSGEGRVGEEPSRFQPKIPANRKHRQAVSSYCLTCRATRRQNDLYPSPRSRTATLRIRTEEEFVVPSGTIGYHHSHGVASFESLDCLSNARKAWPVALSEAAHGRDICWPLWRRAVTNLLRCEADSEYSTSRNAPSSRSAGKYSLIEFTSHPSAVQRMVLLPARRTPLCSGKLSRMALKFSPMFSQIA